MAHPTYPAVHYDEAAGQFVCEMKDKKTGRIWGTGYGATRQEAIYNARKVQPSDGHIKKAIVWVARHPVIAGSVVGAALAFNDARHNGYHDWKRFTSIALTGFTIGLIVWGICKLFGAFRNTDA